jgi:hypothetical protein
MTHQQMDRPVDLVFDVPSVLRRRPIPLDLDDLGLCHFEPLLNAARQLVLRLELHDRIVAWSCSPSRGRRSC